VNLFVDYLPTFLQQLKLYSVECKDDALMMYLEKICGRKRLWPNLRYYPVTRLEGLRKTKENLNQDSRSPGQDLNPRRAEYEAGVLTTTFGAEIQITH
jgi:hypothetical protein